VETTPPKDPQTPSSVNRFKPVPFLERVQNFHAGMVKLYHAERKLVSVDELKSRASECLKCPNRSGCMCVSCGCLLPAKIVLRSEKCPLNIWL
jgi:hypothetical protein